jgi:hypothetical protein
MNYKEFIEKAGVSMEIKTGGVCPDDFKDSDPWAVKLTCDGRTFDMPFYTGKGLREFDPKAFYRVHGFKAIDQDKYAMQINGNYEAPIWRLNEPTLESILDCIASDAGGYENARDFEEWCSEYGYDTDSRKAEKIYQATAEQTKKLRHLIGDNELYKKLLWEIERL